MIHFSSKGKRQQTRRCVNSLRRGSKRTGLVTFFCFFLLRFCFYMRKNLQYKCNTALLLKSQESHQVSILQLSQSIQFILQIFVFKWHFKIPEKKKNVFFSSYTAFPLRLTNTKKKWCVQSVMPKNYSGQINKTKQIKRKYSSSQMRYLCIALCQKRGIKN